MQPHKADLEVFISEKNSRKILQKKTFFSDKIQTRFWKVLRRKKFIFQNKIQSFEFFFQQDSLPRLTDFCLLTSALPLSSSSSCWVVLSPLPLFSLFSSSPARLPSAETRLRVASRGRNSLAARSQGLLYFTETVVSVQARRRNENDQNSCFCSTTDERSEMWIVATLQRLLCHFAVVKKLLSAVGHPHETVAVPTASPGNLPWVVPGASARVFAENKD